MIRPTTRAPVLVHHSSDAAWFTDDRILPGLARSTGAPKDSRALQLVVEDSIPPGLAILDAPDIDSVVVQNRQLACSCLPPLTSGSSSPPQHATPTPCLGLSTGCCRPKCCCRSRSRSRTTARHDGGAGRTSAS